MFLRQAGVCVLFRQACGDTHSFFLALRLVRRHFLRPERHPFEGVQFLVDPPHSQSNSAFKVISTAMLANYYRGRDSSSRRRVPLSDVQSYGAIHLESCSCTLATLPLRDPGLDPLNPPPPCLYCKVEWCGGRGFLRRDSKATCIGSRR